MLFSGISKNRRSERYLNYLAYIGANREVDLAPMAASFGVPVGKLCKDLRRMLARGILPTGGSWLNPTQPLTRVDMAEIIYRVLANSGY